MPSLNEVSHNFYGNWRQWDCYFNKCSVHKFSQMNMSEFIKWVTLGYNLLWPVHHRGLLHILELAKQLCFFCNAKGVDSNQPCVDMRLNTSVLHLWIMQKINTWWHEATKGCSVQTNENLLSSGKNSPLLLTYADQKIKMGKTTKTVAKLRGLRFQPNFRKRVTAKQ